MERNDGKTKIVDSTGAPGPEPDRDAGRATPLPVCCQAWVAESAHLWRRQTAPWGRGPEVADHRSSPAADLDQRDVGIRIIDTDGHPPEARL